MTLVASEEGVRAASSLFLPSRRRPRTTALSLDEKLINVTPTPAFAGLKRLDQRVMAPVIVLRRVLVFGRIAAPDVSAGKAKPQMHPIIARFETFLAALSARLHVLGDLFEVLTLRHDKPPRGQGSGSRGQGKG